MGAKYPALSHPLPAVMGGSIIAVWTTPAQPIAVRRAAASDAAALTRLREVMLSDMGMLAAGADPGWRDKAEAWFTQRLDDKTDFAVFVIAHLDLGVVSCAAGVCDRHAPGPGNPGGVQGVVFNLSTDPRCRHRGYARACLDALLAWFRDETEARVINLNATRDGMALYRSLGFTEPRYPALQLRLVRPLLVSYQPCDRSRAGGSRLAGREAQLGLHGDHRGVERDPGGQRAGVCTVDLTQTDAVERHSCVVNGRLEFLRSFLKRRAVACVIRKHHQAPSVLLSHTTGTLPTGITVMSSSNGFCPIWRSWSAPYQATGPKRSTNRPVPAEGSSVARATTASVPSVTV
jgi:ribosomal protein S18 acetylase RimI-like enzyme